MIEQDRCRCSGQRSLQLHPTQGISARSKEVGKYSIYESCSGKVYSKLMYQAEFKKLAKPQQGLGRSPSGVRGRAPAGSGAEPRKKIFTYLVRLTRSFRHPR
eukprot:7378986-Prymnesium_polylepis.1